MGKEPYIDVRSVSKTFYNRKRHSLLRYESKAVPAVSEVTFCMKQGEMAGLTGKNGAGKTTLLHLLSGLLLPDSGSVRVGGLNPGRNRKKYVSRIGVLLAGRNRLSNGLSVREALEWNSCFYGIGRQRFLERLEYFTELLELGAVLGRQPQELSLGEQMKAELVNVFMHEPEVLFLDEPTIGVDVTVRETIRRFLRRMNEMQGVTMLLASHDRADIRSLCSRVFIMDRGKLSESAAEQEQ